MSVYAGPEIVDNNLTLSLDAANIKSYPNYNYSTYSQDFTNAVYENFGVSVTATGVLAPDGTLTASTLTDDSTTSWESLRRTYAVANNSGSYNISIYIKKTTGGTSTRTGFNVYFSGGTQVQQLIRFNADTGVATGGTTTVTSESNNYWRLSFIVTNNNTGNTQLRVEYYPATGFYDSTDNSTATGSHTVWGFQVTPGTTLFNYKINVNEPANTWYNLASSSYTANLINMPIYNSSGYFSIDGTDRYMTGVLPTLAVGSSVTIEAVIRLNNVIGNKNIWNQGRSTVSFGYGMIIGGANMKFRNSNNDYSLSTPSTLSTGQWYHLVLSVTPTETTGYCNGISQGTTVQVVTTNALTEYIMGRRSSNSATEYMDGDIAFVRIYQNKALTQEEVIRNFNAIRGRFNI